MELQHAINQHSAAHKKLLEAIRNHYPMGARLSVQLGKHVVTGHIVSYGDDWSFDSSTNVYIENERTGKIRRFNGMYPEFYNPVILGA